MFGSRLSQFENKMPKISAIENNNSICLISHLYNFVVKYFIEAGIIGLDHRFHETACSVDDGGYLFLQRPFRHQLEDLDGFFLTDSVYPVRSLILPRRVPPAVIVHHHRARDEIDSRSARFEAAEEDPAVGLFVETSNDLASISSGTGEGGESNVQAGQEPFHHVDHSQKLSKNHHFLSAVQAFKQKLLKQIPFARLVTREA